MRHASPRPRRLPPAGRRTIPRPRPKPEHAEADRPGRWWAGTLPPSTTVPAAIGHAVGSAVGVVSSAGSGVTASVGFGVTASVGSGVAEAVGVGPVEVDGAGVGVVADGDGVGLARL